MQISFRLSLIGYLANSSFGCGLLGMLVEDAEVDED